MNGVLGHDSALIRPGTTWANGNEMNGVLGHDSALLRLHWAGDNLG